MIGVPGPSSNAQKFSDAMRIEHFCKYSFLQQDRLNHSTCYSGLLVYFTPTNEQTMPR